MNLRLSSDAEEAVRRESERLGRSQQEVVRDAIRRHLGLARGHGSGGELDMLVATGTVRPPRTPYRAVAQRLLLPPGISGADLLDRDDRI